MLNSGLLLLALSLTNNWSLDHLMDGEEHVTNSLGVDFVKIPSGAFMMGCNINYELCEKNELPRQRVVLNSFYISTFEITQAQWVAIMGENPSEFKGREYPVEHVSWQAVQLFIKRLNQREDHVYRLPTEAEWEYVARAGTSTAYFFGDNAENLEKYAWFKDNAWTKTHPIGKLKPNPFGVYDILGNVLEWTCSAAAPYSKKHKTRCAGASKEFKILRGGSVHADPASLRSATRFYLRDNYSGGNTGFRLVLLP